MENIKEFDKFEKDLIKEFQKFSFKLRHWIKFYIFGIIFAIMIITIIFSLMFFGDKIMNLERVILIISILSPYIILYIQSLNKKKRIRERSVLIYNKIQLILTYLVNNAETVHKIDESSKNHALLEEYSETDRDNMNLILINIPKYISELRFFDVNELWKFKCVLLDPENNNFHLLNKYIISAKGIYEIKNQRTDLNFEAIKKILLELSELI